MARMMIGPGIATVAGMLLWGLLEYVFHRFVMHGRRNRGIISRTHLQHHQRGSWQWEWVLLGNWAGMVVLGFAIWFPVGLLTGGIGSGLGLALGWTAGFALYEYQHAAIHVLPASTRYGAWMRRHHLHHHFGHPSKNHGVTSPIWDVVFGTYEKASVIRVPARLAPAWLLDESGALRSEAGGWYLLVGGPKDRDRSAAPGRVRSDVRA